MNKDMEVLVERARGGDEDAMAELYSGSYNLSYYIAMQLTHNEEDALDVMQNAYVKAFASLGTLKNPANFQSWLSRIVSNTAKNFLKRKRAVLFSELTAEESDAPPDFVDDRVEASPEEKLDSAETSRLVQEMIDGLSDEQRLVVMMYYFGEQSVADIARDLACPENTVKSRLNYARQKIKKQVLRLQEEGVKLYGAAPLAFFAGLLRQDAAGGWLAYGPAWQTFGNIARQVLPAAGAAGAAAAGAAAGKAVSAKVVAGIVAAAIALGGVAGVVISTRISKPAPDSTSISQPVSSAPGAATVSRPTATPAPAAEPGFYAAAWRQIYYDVAVNNLRAGEMVALQLNIYYTKSGDPLMTMSFGNIRVDDYGRYGETKAYKMWKIENGRAELVFDREYPHNGDYYDLSANVDNGNPTIALSNTEDNITTYNEIINGERVPTYRIEYSNFDENGNPGFYSYAEDKLWSPQEKLSKPHFKLPYSEADITLGLMSEYYDFSREVILQRLGDFFLGDYQPVVPEDAPEWVSLYIQYMRSQLTFSYIPGERMTDDEYMATTEVTFYEPSTPDEAPIISARMLETYGNPRTDLYIMDGNLVSSNRYMEGSRAYWTDAKGASVMSHYYIGYSWQRLTKTGPEYLFDDGVYPDNSAAYAEGGERAYFGTYEESMAWVEEKRQNSFRRYGYHTPLLESPEQTYTLPAEATWSELEQALINVLCQHARNIGQWG